MSLEFCLFLQVWPHNYCLMQHMESPNFITGFINSHKITHFYLIYREKSRFLS